MRVTKTEIIVTLDIPGLHCYPDAPDAVAFLRNEHRHLFKIKVHCSVTHANRDLEFFIVRSELWRYFSNRYFTTSVPPLIKFGQQSCEMIAFALQNDLKDVLPITRVEVWEDGENGAVVEFGE